MAVTIRDVAREAGFSYQTISRVLNNPEKVSPDTIEIVNAAMTKLDYNPNVSARNLLKKTVDVIGFAYPTDSDLLRTSYFFSVVLAETSKLCRQNNLRLEIIPVKLDTDYSDSIIKMYRQKAISGVLLSFPNREPSTLINLKRAEIPFMLIGRPAIDFESYIDSDNIAVGDAAVSRLFELGHRHIGMVNSLDCYTLSQDQMTGFQNALKRTAGYRDGKDLKGQEDFSALAVNTDLTFESSYAAAETLLKKHPELTAVITIDEICALGTIEAAKGTGRAVPDSLSVLSLSYQPWCAFNNPTIAGYDRHIALLGRRAAEILINSIYNNEPPQREIVPFSYVSGQSVASSAIR